MQTGSYALPYPMPAGMIAMDYPGGIIYGAEPTSAPALLRIASRTSPPPVAGHHAPRHTK